MNFAIEDGTLDYINQICIASHPTNFELFVCRREKVFCKTSFQLIKNGPEKRTETSRNERTQEVYPTSGKVHSRCRVVFGVL